MSCGEDEGEGEIDGEGKCRVGVVKVCPGMSASVRVHVGWKGDGVGERYHRVEIGGYTYQRSVS